MKPTSLPTKIRSLISAARRFLIAAILRFTMPPLRMLLGRPFRRFSAVTPQLWVGGQHYRHGWPTMQAQGVTAVVNLRDRRDDAAKKRAPERYLWLPTRDSTAPGLTDIQRAVAFVDDEIKRGGVVYIHCRAGVGRAPTIAACYLVSTGLTPDQAWAKIRTARPFIFPNAGQRRQVQDFYEALMLPSSSAKD